MLRSKTILFNYNINYCVIIRSSQLNVELIEQLSTQQDKVGKLRQLLKVATQKILERSQVPPNLEGTYVVMN